MELQEEGPSCGWIARAVQSSVPVPPTKEYVCLGGVWYKGIILLLVLIVLNVWTQYYAVM